jgi:hypothetical protein
MSSGCMRFSITVGCEKSSLVLAHLGPFWQVLFATMSCVIRHDKSKGLAKASSRIMLPTISKDQYKLCNGPGMIVATLHVILLVRTGPAILVVIPSGGDGV